MKRAALACALFALAACQWDPPHQGARDSAVPPLEVSGYGALQVGMSQDDAVAAVGLGAHPQPVGDNDTCAEQPFRTADGDTLYAMFEEHHLTRITAGNEAPHTRTAQNVGVGSTDAEVRTAYTGVIEQPAKYNEAPAHDLIVWTEPNKAGFRFEIDANGKVMAVHAGGPSILYVEGCA